MGQPAEQATQANAKGAINLGGAKYEEQKIYFTTIYKYYGNR